MPTGHDARALQAQIYVTVNFSQIETEMDPTAARAPGNEVGNSSLQHCDGKRAKFFVRQVGAVARKEEYELALDGRYSQRKILK
ncbi:MAG: hypothetical protein AMXMBFR36_30840 [Acidobacteriota bacterium]